MTARHLAQKLGIPIVLVSVGFGFCFLVLELGLRGIGYDPMGQVAEGRGLILRESKNPLRLFELTPNTSGFAWRTRTKINSYGMRDREVPVERTGAPRVMVIGDSVTFGSGVAPEERFTNRLEVLLSERLDTRVEVMNLGVGGYDTLQEVATLEEVGLRFAPDLVVLAYCVNDAGDNSPNLTYIRSLQDADSRFQRLRAVQLVRTNLDRLRLARRLEADNRDEKFVERFRGLIDPVPDDPELNALRDELERQALRDGARDFQIEWYRSDAHLGKLEHALGRLRNLSQEHGFEVIGAIIPYLYESPTYDVVYRMIEHMLRAQGFDAIPLAPALSQAGLETLRSRKEDPIHPDERGHRLIAEALLPRIASALAARQAH